MGVGHLVLRSCWERTIRQILSRPWKLFSCFVVSCFPCGSVFVLLFVLRQYVMLFCNKTIKVHFLYISFFFSFTYVVMGKSLCRVHVYMSGAHQLTYIPVTAFSQTDYFWFEFISNSDSHRNLIHKWQSQARINAEMSTCSPEAALFYPYRSVLV